MNRSRRARYRGFLPLVLWVATAGDLGTPASAHHGVPSLVSVSDRRSQSPGNSWAPSISNDGRFIAFTSTSPGLIPNDTNGMADVFVRDIRQGTTERVSVSSDATEGDGPSWEPSISGDGRFIAFTTRAENLVDSDTNRSSDVLLHDRRTGETERIAQGIGGSQANGPSRSPVIAADGSAITFISNAFNLTGDDPNIGDDVFILRRRSKSIRLVSKGPRGEPSIGISVVIPPSISSDGQRVAFVAHAADLPSAFPCDYARSDDCPLHVILVYDFRQDRTILASRNADGAPARAYFGSADLDRSGRRLAFWTLPLDGSERFDGSAEPGLFTRDVDTLRTQRVTIKPDGDPADVSGGPTGTLSSFATANSTFPATFEGETFGRTVITDTGEVVFSSLASDLVTDDGNHAWDVFRFDPKTHRNVKISEPESGRDGDLASGGVAASADGDAVSFASEASNLNGIDRNPGFDVFLLQRDPGPCGRSQREGPASGFVGDRLEPEAPAATRAIRGVSCLAAAHGI